MAKKYWTFKGQKISTKKQKITQKISYNKSYNQLQDQTKTVQKRINTINYRYGKDSWGTDRLIEMLDKPNLNVVQNGKIVIPKDISKKDMQLVQNAYNRFLNYKTSSVSGIEEIKKQQIQNIKNRVSTENFELSDKDAETLYKFWEDKDFNLATEKIKASDLWVILSKSVERNLSQKEYLQEIENYINVGNDKDLRNALKNVYTKFKNS